MNSLKEKDPCLITHQGSCRFAEQCVGHNFPQGYAFYAYDSATKKTGVVSDSRAIKNQVELIVRDQGIEFYNYDSNSNSPSADWLCENVCLKIRNCALLIADVTCYGSESRYSINPNVSFEIGLACGMQKPILLLSASRLELLPSNLHSFEIFSFPQDIDRNKFQNALSSILSGIDCHTGFELISSKSLYAPVLQHLETIRGVDWLFASDYHSFLYRPLENLRAIASKTGIDEADVRRRQNIIEKRWVNLRDFLKNDDDVKLYEIFEWEGMCDYFSTGLERRKTSPNPLLVTKAHLLEEINNVQEILSKYYPKVQIAFTNNLLPYAFIARPDNIVIIDSKSDLPDTLNAIVGTYKSIIEQMCNTFWDYWKEIPQEQKKLDYVLSKYDELKSLTEKLS